MIRIDFTAQRIPAAKTSFVKSFRSNSKLVFQTLRNKKIGGKPISLNACTIICRGIVSVHYREEGCIIEPNSRQCQNQCFPNNDETMVDIFSFSQKVKKTICTRDSKYTCDNLKQKLPLFFLTLSPPYR